MNEPDLGRTDRKDSGGRDVYRLIVEYRYEIGPNAHVVIPEGYETNLGTVPRVFHWFVRPEDLGRAAVVHDWMCNEDVTDNNKAVVSGWSRWMADAVFYESMKRMGFGFIKRTAIYLAVRFHARRQARMNSEQKQ